MWDLSTKVLLKLHGEMGMPGRKGEGGSICFFFSPPPFSRREREKVGDETSCKRSAGLRLLGVAICPLHFSKYYFHLTRAASVFDEFLFAARVRLSVFITSLCVFII